MPIEPNELRDRARAKLAELWNEIVSNPTAQDAGWDFPEPIREAIRRTISSSTKSYRYVPLTQLLAKAVDSELDCRALQDKYEGSGAFDARSLCHKVVVPFDRQHHSILGGSPEPYVNNPLRVHGILKEYRSAQKNKAAFDDLCLITEHAQEHPADVRAMLRYTLHVINECLEHAKVIYPVPGRTSLEQCIKLVDEYLTERTGGVRLQAIAVGLFKTIGVTFGLYSAVKSGRVNAADASTGSAADLECLDEESRVVLAVEVKDRVLTLSQLQDKLPTVRSKGIRELLFLVQGGVQVPDDEDIKETIAGEFNAGQNLYVCEFQEFLRALLALLGEAGRRVFLEQTGAALDEGGTDLRHREAWRDALGGIGRR